MKQESDNNKLEVIVDKILEDPELIDARDENPALRELIVDQWYLAVIDEAALADIFSVLKCTGHKHALRAKLQHWEESALYKPGQTSSCSHSPGSSTSSIRGPTHPLLSASVTLSLLEDILERNAKGKIVTQFYRMQQQLDA